MPSPFFILIIPPLTRLLGYNSLLGYEDLGSCFREVRERGSFGGNNAAGLFRLTC